MKSLSTTSRSLRTWLAIAAATAALIGCGGGGDGSDTTAGTSSTGGTGGTGTTGGTVQIVDSFGQVVAAGGADGIGVGDSGADGTAGEGLAIVGGQVQVTDVNGKTATATTDAQGYYRVKVTGFTPPFVAKVTKTNGAVLRSLSVKTLVVNGFITLNITGLTDKVASDVARAAGKSGAADLTPQIVAQNPAAIASSINSIKTQIASAITAAGIDPNNFDPLGAPFRPDGKGYDYLLDHVVVTVAPDGSTQIAPTSTGGTDSGTTWQMHAFVNGTDMLLGTVPGTAVPQTDSQFTANQFATAMSPVAIGSGYTVSGSGNSITITGPGTNYTITVNSFTASGFQYCGTCVPGTEVSVLLSGSFTEGGTLNGTSYPITSTAFSYTFRWVRIG